MLFFCFALARAHPEPLPWANFLDKEISFSIPLDGKVILAIFAHPDDESTIAPILSKYVRDGAEVYLVIATDGRYGTNDHTAHKSGKRLIAKRKKEMKCAAAKLGVNLIHLDYHDQLKSRQGFDGHVPHVKELLNEIYGIVERITPDVIITWGPDGGNSNHMDHRLIGDTATQVFLSKKWPWPLSLYYYGTPHVSGPGFKTIGTDKKYLSTRVTFTNQDLENSYNSLMCHKTQIKSMTFEDYKTGKTKHGKVIYLRKFEGPKKISNTVFE